MKVLVCGGRDFIDQELVIDVLMDIDKNFGVSGIIHGGCRGADWFAHEWVCEGIPKIYRTPEKIFKADWKTHGKAAGPIRNQQMLDEGKPDLVLAFAGGRGTDDMCRRAREAGVEVRRFWPGRTI